MHVVLNNLLPFFSFKVIKTGTVLPMTTFLQSGSNA